MQTIWPAIAVMGLIAAATAAAAPDPSDEPPFTAHVAQIARQQIPGATVDVLDEPRTLSVRVGKAEVKVSLDNLAAACAADQSECDRTILGFVSVVAKATQPVKDTIKKADVRIVARSKSYIDQLGSATDASGAILGLVAGDIWFVCVVDQPNHVASLREDRAKAELKVTREQAIELAKKNVASALRPLSEVVKDLPPNGIGYLNESFYESSRFLLHDDWEPISKKLNGNLVVAVPAADLLFYGDGATPKKIDALATLAKQAAAKSQRSISASVFRWTSKGWDVVR